MKFSRFTFKKHYFLELTIVLASIFILLWISIPKFLQSQNINTPEHIPDPNFRTALEEYIGVQPGEPITKSQAKINTRLPLTCNNREITSIKGIEYFTNVHHLYASNNLIAEIDLSDLPKDHRLSSIYADYNPIKKIAFPGNSNIQDLHLNHCNLSTLDVSNTPKLNHMSINNNSLTSLDVSNCLRIRFIRCSNNRITTLKLPNTNSVVSVLCDNNLLTSLDLRTFNQLEKLYCSNNQLLSLLLPDLSQNLEKIWAENNQLSEIKLGTYPILLELKLNGNNLTKVPKIKSYTYLHLFGVANNNLDCSNWNEIIDLDQYFQTYKNPHLPPGSTIQNEFQYSPQKGIIPYDCSN